MHYFPRHVFSSCQSSEYATVWSKTEIYLKLEVHIQGRSQYRFDILKHPFCFLSFLTFFMSIHLASQSTASPFLPLSIIFSLCVSIFFTLSRHHNYTNLLRLTKIQKLVKLIALKGERFLVKNLLNMKIDSNQDKEHFN